MQLENHRAAGLLELLEIHLQVVEAKLSTLVFLISGRSNASTVVAVTLPEIALILLSLLGLLALHLMALASPLSRNARNIHALTIAPGMAMLAIKVTHVHTSTSIPMTNCPLALSTSSQAVRVVLVAVKVVENLGLEVANFSLPLLVSLLLLLLPLQARL